MRPEVMGAGPIPTIQGLMDRIGMTLADFDIIESNEAFAVQAVSQTLRMDNEKVNPDGGAIALGPPIGAAGAILVVKALYWLRRPRKKRALVTMCIGGGQGLALALEAI